MSDSKKQRIYIIQIIANVLLIVALAIFKYIKYDGFKSPGPEIVFMFFGIFFVDTGIYGIVNNCIQLRSTLKYSKDSIGGKLGNIIIMLGGLVLLIIGVVI